MLKIFIAMVFIVNASVFQHADASDILPEYTLRPMASGDIVRENISHAMQANLGLDNAIDEISSFKKDNMFSLDIETDSNPFVNKLQSEAQGLYEKYKIYNMSIVDRLRFCDAVFGKGNYPAVQDAVHSLFRRIVIDPESAGESITASDYYYLANMLSESEHQYSVLDNSNIRFVTSLVFDLWEHEKIILEKLHIVEQINKELTLPGSGELPFIVAMQDIHGGTRRALSLVAYALGLPADCYKDIRSLDDLKRMLKEHQIDISEIPVRFVGFNDKYDRGNDPVGAFELAEWLRLIGKIKPLIGNHDLWRTLAVLGIYLATDILFEGETIEKKYHPADWAKEAAEHAGWGNIEFDQENQRRFNREVRSINKILREHGLEELELIDLAEVRGGRETELKKIKNKNADIRTENEDRKDEAGYERKPELELPDMFQETLGYLRERRESYNQRIRELNKIHNLGLSDIAFDEVNLDNFFRDSEIIKRALWELKNFRLFYVDILGNLHMHSILPIDYEKGGFDVEYKGLSGLPALELMAKDIRSFFEGRDEIPDSMVFRKQVWDSLGEAFTIINSWYSDREASAKIGAVKKFIGKGGLESLGNEILGRPMQAHEDRWADFSVIIGHNERKKFIKDKLPWIYLYPLLGAVLANIDVEMSEGYADRGALLSFFMRDGKGRITGMRLWGYKKGSDTIEDLTFEDIEGLDQGQLEMLKIFSDGEKFMRWYGEKALQLIEEEAELLKGMALERGRPDKKHNADKLLEQARLLRQAIPVSGHLPEPINTHAGITNHLHSIQQIHLSINKAA